MKTWQVRGIGILAFFGSLAGIGILAYYVILSWPNFLPFIILAPFLAVYVYGAYLGWQILRNVEGALGRSYPFWIVQVPIVASDYVTYQFSSGGAIALTISGEGVVGIYPSIGSYASLSIGVDETLTLGVNILALMIALAVRKLSSAAH